MLEQAGVPDGVINVVPGFGTSAGAAVSSHMDIDMVFFILFYFIFPFLITITIHVLINFFELA